MERGDSRLLNDSPRKTSIDDLRRDFRWEGDRSVVVQFGELGTGAQEVACKSVLLHYKREHMIVEEITDVGTERHAVARGIDNFTEECLVK